MGLFTHIGPHLHSHEWFSFGVEHSDDPEWVFMGKLMKPVSAVTEYVTRIASYLNQALSSWNDLFHPKTHLTYSKPTVYSNT